MNTPKLQNYAKRQPNRQQGFTLMELMVAMAILAILGAISVPLYRNYIQTSQEGVLINNMATIEVFQEDFRLRNGSYAVDLADKAAIEAAVGWNPRDAAEYTYSIANSDGTFYRLTGVDGEGNTICMQFPDKIPCP